MPLNSLGVTFQPGTDARGGTGSATPQLPPQSAVSMLNLRLPTRAAPNALAPQSLLESRGGGGLPIGDSAMALLQRLLALARGSARPDYEPTSGFDEGPAPLSNALAALTQPSAMSMPSDRAPRIVPGREEAPGFGQSENPMPGRREEVY